VKFGPFEDGRRRIVGYQVEVPQTATGVKQFVGTAKAGDVTVPIGGDQTINSVIVPRKTGIKGLVLRPNTGGLTLAPIAAVVPAANVLIWISDDSTRPPFSVRTDDEGRFEVETSAGINHITVPALPAVMSDAVFNRLLPATQEKKVDVKVEDNQVAAVTIVLTAVNGNGEPRLVYTVDEVTLSPSPIAAPINAIHVSAKGKVRSAGWSNPQLRVRRQLSDGMVELDFVAVSPLTPVAQVITPIAAEAEVPIPANFRGVRVFAETNSKEAFLQPQKTGIRALVLRPTLLRGNLLVPIPAEVPAANVTISVSDSSDRPTWIVQTDSNGRFEVETVAGPVTIAVPALPADESAILPSYTLPATNEKTVNVTVVQNQLAEVNIHLTTVPLPPPPPTDTGIRGLVLAPPGGPLAAQPLPNAPVTVDEITDVVVGRPRLHWIGTTDTNGRFQTSTYPGRYRVTATQLNVFEETAEVAVSDHAFTEVTLVIENTMVSPVATQ
jgi:hypothetical protein